MAAVAKFMFDVDFAPDNPAERPIAPAEHVLKLAEAESRAFRDGFATAEKEGTAVAERRTAIAFEHIGDALNRLAGGLADIERRLEAEAVEVAVAVGRKLAPELVSREPFGEIAALATECFKQLVAAPHVAVRANDALHQVARERLEEIARARGFEGRLIVIAEPEIAVGDCRIEWADGGATRDMNAIEAAIAEAVSRYIGALGSRQPELGETTT